MKTSADKIFINARAYTLESEGVCKEAIVVKDGKFAYVGSNETALADYQADQVIDLEGKTVLPGMGDSHLHFAAFCKLFSWVDLGGAGSKKEAIDMLAAKAAETPEGEWITGFNFDQSKWDDSGDRLPTREDLDKATVRHPVMIKRVCMHAAVANTAAIQKAGIGKDYDFGEGGLVELDKDGIPTGIFREQASRIFDEIIPDPFENTENKKKCMKKGFDMAVSYGLTMMHTYASEIYQYFENYDDYLELNRKGQLPVRMTVCIDNFYNKPFVTKAEREDPFRAVQYGTFKIFSDGSLGSRSAKLYEPYADDPDTTGMLVISQEDLNERMLKAYEMWLQPAVHCIGDMGLDVVLTAIEYTLEKSRERGMTEREQRDRLPFRIIHAQMSTPQLIERMKKLPVELDIQPVFFLTDMHWIRERVGDKRADMSYVWKTYKDAGLMMSGGSDCPVEIFSPWNGIYSMVTRKDLDGNPEGGMQPEEKLSVYDAVCMYSKNVPYANGEQDLMGTIEAGKFADMVVIDRDIFNIPDDELKDVQALYTYMAGCQTYCRE